jgi:hypothetical protein
MAINCMDDASNVGRPGAGAVGERPKGDARHEALRRVASVAVARNHHKALSGYLAQGLDPNAMCYAGARWPELNTLLEEASEHDSLECFIALRAAGARVTWRSTQFFFHTQCAGRAGERRLILSHLFDSGELDPTGELWPDGMTCVELASMSSSSAALDAIAVAISRRERVELTRGTEPSDVAYAKRRRSL